jgi:hypothetical protein
VPGFVTWLSILWQVEVNSLMKYAEPAQTFATNVEKNVRNMLIWSIAMFVPTPVTVVMKNAAKWFLRLHNGFD